MTDTTDGTPIGNEDEVPEEAPDVDQNVAQDPGDPAEKNSEAARYRRRLREVEAERDTLAARVESLNRREIEAMAAARLAHPEDLWLLVDDLDSMLTEDGNPDADRVAAEVDKVLDLRPGWAVMPRSAPPTQKPVPDMRSGSGTTADPPRTFAEQLVKTLRS